MYVDERENPNFLLNLSEEGLLMRLGLVDFQIEQYGSYDPNTILKADFSERGIKLFQKYASMIRSKMCAYYDSMKKSGVLDTTESVYFFLIGYLMATNETPRAIAVCVAAIMAKQGLYSLCKKT